MSKDIRDTSGECCKIWNSLKDKTQMIDYLIESKQQISDLEAKLAESELKYNATNRAYWELVEKQDNAFLQYEKLIGENQQLKQQLAEKEQELENWEDGTIVEKLWHAERQLAEKEKEIKKLNDKYGKLHQCYGVDLREKYRVEDELQDLKKDNQDKISFCIGHLSQIKGFIKDKLEYMWNNNAEMTCRDRSIIDGIYKEIEDKIENLKGNEDE